MRDDEIRKVVLRDEHDGAEHRYLEAYLADRGRLRILDVLERAWTGERSHELERRLRESGIPIERHVWSG